MSLMSWLQQVVADFFGADKQEFRRIIAQAEADLRDAREAAAQSVARAQRARLELFDAMAQDQAPAYELLRSAEEADARARREIDRYRQQRDHLQRCLCRADDTLNLDRENRRRNQLRRSAARTDNIGEFDDLDDIETRTRAEAARLDALDSLERGEPPVSGEDLASYEQRVRDLINRPLPAELEPGP